MQFYGFTMKSCTADAQKCAPASFSMSENRQHIWMDTAILAVSIFIGLLLVLDIRLCLLVVLPVLELCLAVLLWRRKAPKKQAYASRPPEKHLG